MLENLTDKMSKAIRHLRGLGKLSEENMAEALKDVRMALLSADVHFKVARDFIQQVQSSCLGQEVIKSISPGQQVVKIIHDELVKLLGDGSQSLCDVRPLKIMMVGLHGSGKTTTSVKLAKYLKKKGLVPSVIACDIYRPAAIDQLALLAQKEDILCYIDRESKNVEKIGDMGLKWGREQGANVYIFDTAGRLQIDLALIEEIKQLSRRVEPHETLLVGDSALGQEAVNVAKHFHEAVHLTGIILTKLDGDARGGAALSMKSVTGVPIKFMGVGEKTDDLEVFHPDRIAQRVLGMGDVVSLVEKAQENIDQEEAKRLAKKLKKADFDFEDLLSQMRQVRKMGSISSLMSMLPGMHDVKIGDAEENQMKRTEAMILSMTVHERKNPQVINGSRRLRIAKGSGVSVREVNQLFKQYNMMRKMMKSMRGPKGASLMKKLSGMGGNKISKNGLGF